MVWMSEWWWMCQISSVVFQVHGKIAFPGLLAIGMRYMSHYAHEL